MCWVEFHRSNGASIVDCFRYGAYEVHSRKSCIGLRKLWTPRPLVEAEILPVKPETSSEEDPEEIPEEDPKKIPEEDSEEDPEEISKEGSEEDSEEDSEKDEKEDSKREQGKSLSKGSCSKKINKKAAILIDPALESDAESEYRPMNSVQPRFYSPANSGESQESRVGPKRRRVSYPPTIYSDSPYEATCAWEG